MIQSICILALMLGMVALMVTKKIPTTIVVPFLNVVELLLPV